MAVEDVAQEALAFLGPEKANSKAAPMPPNRSHGNGGKKNNNTPIVRQDSPVLAMKDEQPRQSHAMEGEKPFAEHVAGYDSHNDDNEEETGSQKNTHASSERNNAETPEPEYKSKRSDSTLPTLTPEEEERIISYLEGNEVFTNLNKLVANVLQERPEDPELYLLQQLGGAIPEDVPNASPERTPVTTQTVAHYLQPTFSVSNEGSASGHTTPHNPLLGKSPSSFSPALGANTRKDITNIGNSQWNKEPRRPGNPLADLLNPQKVAAERLNELRKQRELAEQQALEQRRREAQEAIRLAEEQRGRPAVRARQMAALRGVEELYRSALQNNNNNRDTHVNNNTSSNEEEEVQAVLGMLSEQPAYGLLQHLIYLGIRLDPASYSFTEGGTTTGSTSPSATPTTLSLATHDATGQSSQQHHLSEEDNGGEEEEDSTVVADRQSYEEHIFRMDYASPLAEPSERAAVVPVMEHQPRLLPPLRVPWVCFSAVHRVITGRVSHKKKKKKDELDITEEESEVKSKDSDGPHLRPALQYRTMLRLCHAWLNVLSYPYAQWRSLLRATVYNLIGYAGCYITREMVHKLGSALALEMAEEFIDLYGGQDRVLAQMLSLSFRICFDVVRRETRRLCDDVAPHTVTATLMLHLTGDGRRNSGGAVVVQRPQQTVMTLAELIGLYTEQNTSLVAKQTLNDVTDQALREQVMNSSSCILHNIRARTILPVLRNIEHASYFELSEQLLTQGCMDEEELAMLMAALLRCLRNTDNTNSDKEEKKGADGAASERTECRLRQPGVVAEEAMHGRGTLLQELSIRSRLVLAFVEAIHACHLLSIERIMKDGLFSAQLTCTVLVNVLRKVTTVAANRAKSALQDGLQRRFAHLDSHAANGVALVLCGIMEGRISLNEAFFLLSLCGIFIGQYAELCQCVCFCLQETESRSLVTLFAYWSMALRQHYLTGMPCVLNLSHTIGNNMNTVASNAVQDSALDRQLRQHLQHVTRVLTDTALFASVAHNPITRAALVNTQSVFFQLQAWDYLQLAESTTKPRCWYTNTVRAINQFSFHGITQREAMRMCAIPLQVVRQLHDALTRRLTNNTMNNGATITNGVKESHGRSRGGKGTNTTTNQSTMDLRWRLACCANIYSTLLLQHATAECPDFVATGVAACWTALSPHERTEILRQATVTDIPFTSSAVDEARVRLQPMMTRFFTTPMTLRSVSDTSMTLIRCAVMACRTNDFLRRLQRSVDARLRHIAAKTCNVTTNSSSNNTSARMGSGAHVGHTSGIHNNTNNTITREESTLVMGSMGALTGSVSRAPLLRVYGQRTLLYTMTHTATKMRCFAKLHEHILDDWEAFLRDPGTAYDCSKAVFDVIPAEYTSINDVYLFLEDVRSYPQKYMRVFAASVTRQEVDTVAVFLALHRRVTMSAVEVLVLTIFNLFIQQHPEYLRAGEEYELLKLIDHIQRTSIDLRCLMQMHLRHLTPMQRFLQAHLADGEVKRHLALHATRYGAVSISDRLLLAGPRMTHSLGAYAIISEPMSTMSLWCTNTLYVEVVRSVSTGSAFAESWFTRQAVELLQSLGLTLAMLRSGTAMPSCRALLTNALLKGCPVAFVRRTLAAYFDTLRGLHVPFDPRLQDLFNAVLHGHMDQSLDDSEVGARMMGRLLHGKHNNNTALSPMRTTTTTMNSSNGKADNASQAAALIAHVMELDEEEERSAARRFAMYCTRHGLHLPTRAFVYRIMYEGPTMERTATGGIYVHSVSSLTQHGGASSSVATNPYSRNSPSSRQGNDNNEEDGEGGEEGDVTTSAKGGDEVALVGQDLFYEIYHTLCLLSRLLLLPRTALTSHSSSSALKQEQLCRGQIASLLQCDPTAQAGLRQLLLLGLGTSATGMDVLTCFGRYMTRQLPQLFERGQKYRRERVVKATGLWMRCMTELGDCVQSLMQNLYTPRQLPAANVITALPERFVTLNVAPALDCVACVEADLMPGGTSALQYTSGSAVEYYNPLCEVLYEHLRYNQHGDMRMTCRHLISLLEGGPGDLVTAVIVLLCSLREYERPDNKSTTTNSPGKTSSSSSMAQKKSGRNGIDANQRMGRGGGSDAGAMRELEGYMEDNSNDEDMIKAEEEKDSDEIDSPVPAMKEVEESEESKPSERRQRGKHSWAQDCIRFLFSDLFQSVLYYTQVLLLQYEEQVQKSVDWALRHYKLSTTALLSAARLLVDAVPMVEPGLPLSAELLKPTQQHQISTALVNTLLAAMSIIENTAGELPHQIRDDAEMHAAQDLSRQSAPKPRQSNAVRFLRLQHYRSLLVPADLLELLLTFGIMPREVMILADLFTNAVMRRATTRREGNTNSSNTGGGSSGVMSTTSSMSHFSTAPRKPPISSSSVTTTVVPASNNIGNNNNSTTVNEGYERSVTSDHNSSNGTSNSGHRLADSMLALWRHYICLVNDSLRQCLRVAHCRLLQRSLRQKVTLLMHNAVSSEQLGQLLHIGLVRQARQHHNRALSRDAMSLGHPSQAAVFEDELSAEMRESRPFVEAWQMPGLLLACDLDSEESSSNRVNDCGTGEACEEKTHAADPNAAGLDESTALFVSLTNLAVGATEVNTNSSTATAHARNETGMEGAAQRTMRSLHKCASTTVGPGPQKSKFLHTTTQAHSPVARFNTLAGAQRMTQIYDTNSLVNSPAGSNDRHGQLDVMASPPQMSWHSSSSHVRLAETLPASVCRSIFFDALHNENGAFLQSLLHTARTAIGHTSDIKSTTGSETTSSSSASFDFAQALLWSFYKQLSSGATVPLARTLCFTFSELKELTYVWQTYAHLMSTTSTVNGASPTLSFPIYPVQNAENNTSNRSSPTNSPILNHLNVLSPTTAATNVTLVDEIAELFAGSRPGRQQKMYEAVRQLDDVMRNRFARLADWPTFSRVLCAYVADLTLYEQRLLHVLLQRYWAPLVHRICRRLAASGASEPQLLLVVRALRSMRVALAVLRRMQCRMQVSLLLRTLPHGAITAFTQQFSASAMVMTGPHRGSMSFLRVPHGGTTSNNNTNTTNAVVRLVSHAPNSSAGTNAHGRKDNKDNNKDTHNSGADDASLNTDQQILQAIEDIMYDFEHTVLEDDKAPREMHSELHVFTSWLEKCRPQTGIYALVEVLREVDKIPPPPLLDGADMHAPRGGVGNALAQDHLYLFLACSFLFHRLTSELFYDAPRLPPFSTMPVFMTNEVRIGLTLQPPQTQHNTFTNNNHTNSAVAVVGGHDATHNSIIATGAAHRSSLQQQQQQQQRRHNNNGLGVSILSTSSVVPTFMTGQEWGQRRGNNNNNMNRNGSDFAPLDALQQTGITTNARRRREPFVATLTLSHVMVQQCITNTLELLLREKSEATQGTKADKGPDTNNATTEGGEETGLHSLTPCPAEHVDKIDLKSTLRDLLESIVAFITAGMEDSSDLVPLFYKIQPRLMRGVRQLFWYSYADFCFICYTLQSSMQRLVYVRANPQLNIIIDRLNGTLCRTMYTHYHSSATHVAASQNGQGTMRGLLQATHSISSPLNMHGYAPSVASVSPQNSRSRLSTATNATHNANHGDYWSMSKASSAVMSACSSVTRAPTAHSHPSRWATSTMTENNGQAAASVVAMQRYIEHCQSKEFPFTTLKCFTFIWLQLLSELTDLYLQALPNFRQHFAQHTQHRAHDDYLRYFIILLHQIAFVCGTVPWPTFNLIHTLIQDWIKFVQERLQVLGLRQMQQTAQQAAATATAAAVVDAGFMGAEMEGCDMIDIPTTTAAAAKSAPTENDPYMCKSVSVADIATSAMHALTLVIAAQSHNTLTLSVPPWRSDLHLAIATLMTGSVEAGLALPHVQRIGYPTQEQIALAPIEAAVWERALGYILFLVRGLAPHEESRKHGTGGNTASSNTNSNNIHASSSSPHSPTTMEEAESSKSCMNATSTMTPYTQRPLMREDSADSTTKTNSTIPPTGLNAAREHDERAHTFSAASTNNTSVAANRSSQRPSQQAKEEKHHGSSAKPRGTSHERVITLAEVKEANTPKKTWTVINDVVYDITRYVYIHPGGIRWMLQNCAGRDATAAFLQQHGGDQVVLQQLEHFRIGVLDVQAQQRHSMYSI